MSYETWDERQRTINNIKKARRVKNNENSSRWIMTMLGLLLNKTSWQGKKAVKGDRGKERRYRRKAINMSEGKRRYK